VVTMVVTMVVQSRHHLIRHCHPHRNRHPCLNQYCFLGKVSLCAQCTMLVP
jgi:hypothetical protein